MELIFTSLDKGITVSLPVSLIFWCGIIILVLHVMEESLIPEVFVEKMKRLYFPAYSWGKFAGFNTIMLVLNITGVICYETFAGAWVIFPLALMTERVFNGIYHLGETIVTKKFSAGLFTSVMVWILAYLLVRYSVLKGEISPGNLITSLIIGFSMFALMIFPMVSGVFRNMKPKQAA